MAATVDLMVSRIGSNGDIEPIRDTIKSTVDTCIQFLQQKTDKLVGFYETIYLYMIVTISEQNFIKWKLLLCTNHIYMCFGHSDCTTCMHNVNCSMHKWTIRGFTIQEGSAIWVADPDPIFPKDRIQIRLWSDPNSRSVWNSNKLTHLFI